jgi:DNA-binding beta-propeller fold protein YncE
VEQFSGWMSNFHSLLFFFSFWFLSTSGTHDTFQETVWQDSSFPRQLTGEFEFVISVTTLAGVNGSTGSTNGMGTNSRFNNPTAVSISPDGVYALVSDRDSQLIRKIILTTASVTTFVGKAGSIGSTNGMGTNSRFYNPHGVPISPDGTYALIADYANQLIRKVVVSTGSVTTLAGMNRTSGSTNGMGTNSKFFSPQGLSISPDGVLALVADRGNHLVRKIIISTASVTTLAGVNGTSGSINGMGTNSKFYSPTEITISPDGVYALVADRLNHLLRKIIITSASVTTLAGVAGSFGSTNGIGTVSKFKFPYGLDISPDGVYALLCDRDNQLIRMIVMSTASVTTLAGVLETSGSTDGSGSDSKFGSPFELAISPDGSYALVADTLNHLIRKIDIQQLTASPTVSPTAAPTVSPTAAPSAAPTARLRYSFGVLLTDQDSASTKKALLLNYLTDTRRGSDPPSPRSFLLLSFSSPALVVSHSQERLCPSLSL